MATSKKPAAGPASTASVDPTDVGRIEKEQLAWTNILKLKGQINKATREQSALMNDLNKLQGKEAKNSRDAKTSILSIKRLEQDLINFRKKGNQSQITATKQLMAMEKANLEQLKKTQGGYLRMQESASAKQKAALLAERGLIQDINKQRGLGTKIADVFRSKEAKQKNIDRARVKAGGGANTGAAAAGGGGEGALAAGPEGAMVAALIVAGEKMKAPFKAMAGAIKDGITAPLGEAASILGTEKVGIGGGKVSGAGATSILDGLGDMLGTIPFIGGALKGLTSAFKTILDAVLGIDQANVNVARNMGISNKQAQAFRFQMQQASLASGNIVVNQTRLIESQLELGSAMGITNQMSISILENNVKLKDIMGLEAAERQAIAESSIITGKNAEGLTKELMGQVGYVKKMTGISFNFRNVMGDLSKLSGVLGLQFAKYPGKVAETMMKVKVLGFDLKQLRDQASGFLDFETSISKEFEAQVLTGKDMNLTKAREAALNNDMAGLSAEITRNVGNSTAFLKLNRIQQDAVAESVNMTADGLADVMKKQEIYNKLGANNQKDALANFDLLNKTKKGKDELIAKLGEENYAGFTQISTAEKLAAVMEKIKQTFIDFIEKSKVFDFLTNPEKVNGFIKSILNGLAGAIDTVGMIMAGIVDVIGDVVGIFNEEKGASFHAMAASITSGAGSLAGGMRAVGGSLGGEAAPGLGAKTAAAAAPAPAAAPMAGAGIVVPYAPTPQQQGNIYLDGSKVGSVVFGAQPQLYGQNTQ